MTGTSRIAKIKPAMAKSMANKAMPAGFFLGLYKARPIEKIEQINQGIQAERVPGLARLLGLNQLDVIGIVGLARSSINRKVSNGSLLAKDEGERILGVEALIGQVEAMVLESGDPTGFDAGKWVGDWIKTPNAALGGIPPASFLNTVEGQKLVASILAMAQTGAYA